MRIGKQIEDMQFMSKRKLQEFVNTLNERLEFRVRIEENYTGYADALVENLR